MKRRSPIDLRDDSEYDSLEPYQPARELAINGEEFSNVREKEGRKQFKRKWLSKLPKSLPLTSNSVKERLSTRLGRLSSLDSTQTNSSIEMDPSGESQARQASSLVAPIISITSNEPVASQQEASSDTNRLAARIRRHQEVYGNNSAKSRRVTSSMNERDEDDEDEDFFNDSPLPMPYSSTAMSRSTIIRQQTDNGTISYPATFEELLDDRQGMNSSEQQFTKGEKANRSSMDGSIISELRLEGKKSGGKLGKKERQRRSKSPSSSSLTRRGRHSKGGGFLSKFKLTKKHESIAKLQLSILNSGFMSLKTLDKDLQSFLPRDRLTTRDFQQRVRLMRRFEVLSTIEYRFASRYETYVCKHAQLESNQAKNNYKKCIPYDYNRVVLKTLPNVPDSDYVNASHVDSLLKPNAYIAAQGPNEFTIEDFWRMVWEQKTFVIVMLTKVFDFIRVMCNQYWPVELNKPERYGNVEVTLLYEEPLADFVIRTIRLTRLKSSQKQGAGGGGGGEGKVEEKAGEEKLEDMTSKQTMLASDADEIDFSDEFSEYSEELIIDATQELDKSLQNLTVRSPRFVSARSRDEPSVRGRSLSPQPRGTSQANEGSSKRTLRAPSGSPAPIGTSKKISKADQQVASDGATKRCSQNNDFLHPLFNSSYIASSLNSLSSEPATPVTPRTPSSAGIDRSSATRRAVKKKRRERVKNQRPRRTQFMAPTESQLIDDDNDNDEDEDDHDEQDEEEQDELGTAGCKSNERIIYQFHYNSWASHTCPFISSLLHFRRRVRICMDEMAKSGKTGPTIVHCNDGCGRTGAYLCIDANLELAEEDNLLDVYNYTRKMRQSRKFLIENLEQYKFVYDTIDEALFCGRTWFPVSDLHKRLKHKSQRNPITKKNEYLVEYEKICQMTSKFSIGDCAGGHRVENREKNRDVSTVPPDNFRPYLTSFQTNDSTDYINAVFVDGYTRSKEYIVTEWPLHRTISDFWSLVYDHDCNSVILLANPTESSNYPSFLPSEKELRRKFGPVFSAEMVSYTHYQNIKSWIYTINKKIVSLTEVIAGVKSEAKTTQVFQITCWPQGHRVPTSTNALVELMNMVERWRQRTTYGPVCVVSLNGKSRAGVYCAANVAIEQVVQHSEVDVFNAVKTVRRHRPQLIENMTEYKYCYDLILHYVLHYVNNQSPSNS